MKPFGFITPQQRKNVSELPAHLDDYQVVMIRNTEYGQATVPIYLGEAVTPAVINAGIDLANIAFNLCQRDDIPARDRDILKKAYQAWDNARRIK